MKILDLRKVYHIQYLFLQLDRAQFQFQVLHFDISLLYFLYSQAIKECIHHATSLSEGVLRVGTLGWPLEVSASHMTQLQFATTVENIMETELHQV